MFGGPQVSSVRLRRTMSLKRVREESLTRGVGRDGTVDRSRRSGWYTECRCRTPTGRW